MQGSPPDTTLWGFAEWSASLAIAAAVAVVGFVWRFLWKVGRMEAAIEIQRADFDKQLLLSLEERKEIFLAQKVLQEEHHKLREMLMMQPTKTDLIALETRLGTQLDRIVQRIDSAMAK